MSTISSHAEVMQVFDRLETLNADIFNDDLTLVEILSNHTEMKILCDQVEIFFDSDTTLKLVVNNEKNSKICTTST